MKKELHSIKAYSIEAYKFEDDKYCYTGDPISIGVENRISIGFEIGEVNGSKAIVYFNTSSLDNKSIKANFTLEVLKNDESSRIEIDRRDARLLMEMSTLSNNGLLFRRLD